MPPLQVHPLPAQLMQWQDSGEHGDYFSAIQPIVIQQIDVGYLVWSQFPVKVYIEPSAAADPSQDWVEAVKQAIQEWNSYLPLELVEAVDIADISIWRTAPPLQNLDQSPGSSTEPETEAGSNHRLPRVRSAETRYQLFVDRSTPNSARLGHRFTVQISPNQTIAYIKATARHELGHALGIWGHSSLQTDALYFSQVRNPPPVSARDINTLKRIYQQPTRLGWPVSSG